jgi:hypothetical protein
VDFAPLLEGRHPQALIEGLRQVKARVDDSGPPLSALGLCGCAGGSGRGSGPLGHENAPGGLPRPDKGAGAKIYRAMERARKGLAKAAKAEVD